MAPPGMQPGQGQNLRAAIASQSAPVNPNTPNERSDPRESELLNLNRIRRALERALEPYEATGPSPSADVLHMMHGVVSRMLAGVNPTEALMVGMQSIVPLPMQGGAVPGMAAPPAPAGQMPMPGGMPPGMGGPVSPGAVTLPSPPG